MLKIFAASAIALMLISPGVAAAKNSTSINVAENAETYASIGDVLVKVSLRESLPNAFGGSDIFGRKRDRGFVEIRYMGLAQDGRAVFRRRTVDIYSNETTMSRSGLRYGYASVQPQGAGASVQGFSTGAPAATVAPLPADTIEFALDVAQNRVLTVEDRQLEIRKADGAGVSYVVTRRAAH